MPKKQKFKYLEIFGNYHSLYKTIKINPLVHNIYYKNRLQNISKNLNQNGCSNYIIVKLKNKFRRIYFPHLENYLEIVYQIENNIELNNDEYFKSFYKFSKQFGLNKTIISQELLTKVLKKLNREKDYKFIENKVKAKKFISVDIKDFYDSIKPNTDDESVNNLIRISSNTSGIITGPFTSKIVSEIYLEKILKNENYILDRFSDEIIIENKSNLKKLVNHLSSYDLKINESKTQINNIQKHIQNNLARKILIKYTKTKKISNKDFIYIKKLIVSASNHLVSFWSLAYDLLLEKDKDLFIKLVDLTFKDNKFEFESNFSIFDVYFKNFKITESTINQIYQSEILMMNYLLTDKVISNLSMNDLKNIYKVLLQQYKLTNNKNIEIILYELSLLTKQHKMFLNVLSEESNMLYNFYRECLKKKINIIIYE